MLGFLLYVNTIANVPYVFILVPFFYALFYRKKQVCYLVKYNKQFICVLGIFLLGCTFNNIFQGASGIPNMYMHFITVLFAFALTGTDIKVFAVLTAFECFVGIYEYSLGITSILPGTVVADFIESDLLYFKRVYGLSNASSSFSQKILYSIIFVAAPNQLFSKRVKGILILVFGSGLFCTFNRTALIVAIVYVLIVFYKELVTYIKTHPILGFMIAGIMMGYIVTFIQTSGSDIMMQFTRGDMDNALTGRPVIWAQFFSFINENPFFGNGSVHLLVPYYSGPAHAHNSYIQLLADHGIFLSLIYFLNFTIKLNKSNLILCFPFLFTSLSQYILFWGYCLADVFFYAILCNPFFMKTMNIYAKN